MRMRSLVAVSVLIVSTLGLAVPTSVGATGVSPSVTVQRATLTGLVRDADRRPVVGAIVEVFSTTGEFVNDARTTTAGTFAVPSLTLGTYRVRARPPSTRPWATAWAPSAGSFLTAGTIKVRSFGGKATITLPYGAVLAGTVTGLTARATVKACGTSFLDCRATLTTRGAFRIPNLAAGVVQVYVQLSNGRWLSFPAQPPRPGVRLTAGRTLTIRLNATQQTAPTIVSR